jgi:UDP-N-acetylmuramoyl-tripeptide--D-alanyl-D-alanine ligase
MDADGSDIVAVVEGERIAFRLNAPGRHMTMNAMAALAAVMQRAREAAALLQSGFAPVIGRGARRRIAVRGGSALLLDESYNGNPASIRAALAVLRLQPAQRRIAVLGDMLELGDVGPAEHRALASDVAAAADCLFACGPLMRELYTAVPEAIRGAHTSDSSSLAPIVAGAIAAGDAVLIKGSLGSRMKLVVNALEPRAEAA